MHTLVFRGPFASDALGELITVLWLLLYALALLGLFFHSGINWLSWLFRYRLLLILLLAGAVASIAWSYAPSLTLKRSIHLVGSTLLALYIGFTLPLNHLLRITAVVLGLLMALSIAAVVALPELGLVAYEGELAWAGVMASKNTLGFWATTSVLLNASLLFWPAHALKRTLYLILTSISFVCLVFSQSATSLLALICAAITMLYLHAALTLRLGLLSMLVLGILAAGMAGMAFYFIDTAAIVGRSGDLTGRSDVWEQTWALVMARPLTGYGYGTIWFPTPESLWIQESLTHLSWVVFHAHNGLLQIASELGLPLTLLTVLMIVQHMIEVIYCQYQRQQPGVIFIIGFSVALLLSNYSEARLLVNRELYWIMFIMLPVSMLQQIIVVSEQPGSSWLKTNSHGQSSKTLAGLRAARERITQKRTMKIRPAADNTFTARTVNAETLRHRPLTVQPSAPLGSINITPVNRTVTQQPAYPEKATAPSKRSPTHHSLTRSGTLLENKRNRWRKKAS